MLGSYGVGLGKQKNLSQALRGSNHLGELGGEKGGGEAGQKSRRRVGWVGDSRRQAKEVEMVWPHPLRPDWWPHLLCSPFLSLEAAPGSFLLSMAKVPFPVPDSQGFRPECRKGEAHTLRPPCLAYRGLLTVLHAMPGV